MAISVIAEIVPLLGQFVSVDFGLSGGIQVFQDPSVPLQNVHDVPNVVGSRSIPLVVECIPASIGTEFLVRSPYYLLTAFSTLFHLFRHVANIVNGERGYLSQTAINKF